MDALAAANADAREVDDAIQLGAEMSQADAGVDDMQLEAELAVLANEVEIEKAQSQRERLNAEELRVPAHPPSSGEAALTKEGEKVPVAL